MRVMYSVISPRGFRARLWMKKTVPSAVLISRMPRTSCRRSRLALSSAANFSRSTRYSVAIATSSLTETRRVVKLRLQSGQSRLGSALIVGLQRGQIVVAQRAPVDVTFGQHLVVELGLQIIGQR